jgi:hypothetical protein
MCLIDTLHTGIFGAKTRFLSFNRTQSRAVTGLLNGQSTLRRHPHLMGCRRSGAEDETSVHTLCEFEDLAALRHVYPGSFFLEQEDTKSIKLGANWNFSKGHGLHKSIWGTKSPLIKA